MSTRRASRWFALASMILAACSSGGSGDDDPDGTPRIVRFAAEPNRVMAGQAATLSWEVVGTAGVSIEPQVGLQPPTGTVSVRPIATTTYTLRVDTANGPLMSTVTVEVEGGPASVDAFTATPQTVGAGEPSVLMWSTSNAAHVIIEPGIGMQAARGSLEVRPMTTTAYRLTAVGLDGSSATAQVQVVVASGNQPRILSFTATPQSVTPGLPVTLAWEVTNADSVTIDNQVGLQPVTGSVTVMPAQTTSYTLTAVGPGGNVSASVSVTVVPTGDPVVVRYVATPDTVPPGGRAVLDWEVDNATRVTISGLAGNQMTKGTAEVTPSQTTTYTLTAFGNGQMITRDVTVTVSAPDAPAVLEFAAQPAAVNAGGSTTLVWRTVNATSVDIDNGVGAALAASDSVQVSPSQTTTYTLTARGANGSATAQVTVTVAAGPAQVLRFVAMPASIVSGGSTTIAWETSGATSVSIDNGIGAQAPTGMTTVSPTQTTLYTLTASGPGGNATGLLTVTVTNAGAPTITSFTVMPQQIAPGGSASLAWQTSGADTVSIDNGIGMQATSGSISVSPAATTTYTIEATGPGGTTTAQVTLTVASVNGDQCGDAFDITGSGQFTGNTQTATGDYDPGAGGCTNFAAAGPDVVYKVRLQTGDRLVASLSASGWDASLYLVRNCGDVPSSCVTGQDNGDPEQIDYTAAATGDYFLIVDGFRAGGPYTLDVSINTAPIANDQCGGAIDATAGGRFSGTTRGAANDYDPGTGGCTRYAERSGDVAYRVDLAAGERLQASLQTTWDSALYLVRDCAMAAASCVAGQDNGNPEEVDYTAMAAGTFFLIVDGYGSAAGSFDLDVTVSPPVQGGDTCQTAVPIPTGGGSFQASTAGMAADYAANVSCTGYETRGPDMVYAASLGAGDVVEVLAEFDAAHDGTVYATDDCATLGTSCLVGSDEGGRGRDERLRFVARRAAPHYVVVDAEGPTWVGGHDLTVVTYTGETCADAPPLRLGAVPEWFTTAGKANDYSPNSGGCTQFSANAGDRAYRVGLTPGDQLLVAVQASGSYDPSVYLVSDCADVNGSCVAGTDRVLSSSETLAAMVQQAGNYFLILDGFSGSTGEGTMTATIAHGDTCDDAYFVPPTGGTFRGTTTGYRADYGTTVRTGSCTGWQQSGPDAVYRVDLTPGQRLQATLTTSWDASLYLITSCAQSATSCVAGSDRGNPESLSFTHNGTGTGTYYLVVDGFLSTTAGNYTLALTIQ